MATNVETETTEGTLDLTRFAGPAGGDRFRLQVTVQRGNETAWAVLTRMQARKLIDEVQALLEAYPPHD